MSQSRQTVLAARMKREIEMLQTDPPHGVCAWPRGESLAELEATIQGPDDTPYAKGCFRLLVEVPENYPFEPPRVRFSTPIYHPNVDSSGLICLDTLNMPPKGSWKPSLNLSTVLTMIRELLASPNPDDGLMAEITAEYRQNRPLFVQKARECTERFAMSSLGGKAAGPAGRPSPDQPPSAPPPLPPPSGPTPSAALTVPATAKASAAAQPVPSATARMGKRDAAATGSPQSGAAAAAKRVQVLSPHDGAGHVDSSDNDSDSSDSSRSSSSADGDFESRLRNARR